MPPKSSKSKKPPSTPPQQSSISSSLHSHLAMIELKYRILTSVSKPSHRDTHQIAVEDIERIIQTLTPDGVTQLLNSLYEATTGDANKLVVKKEAIRLLLFLCSTHTDLAATHLPEIITHIVKRVKDSDDSGGVRDACGEAIGELSSLYLRGENCSSSVVSLFVKPLFEGLNDEDKEAQVGSAMCMAKMVEMASGPPILAFQKLLCSSRICKYLNHPSFLAKAALLQVVSTLSQVGAISLQGLEPLLQSIHDCLTDADWATRKAAAEALNTLALCSTNLIIGKTGPTITALEDCRFDMVKPARDSIVEALQQWQRLAGGFEDHKTPGHDGEDYEPAKSGKRKPEAPPENYEPEGRNISKKAAGILNKKAGQKVDRGTSGSFRRREFEDMNDSSQREGFRSNEGNWLAIQRQLLQLERQQAHLMNMLKDFMDGSHDDMATLKNRMQSLEHVVENMVSTMKVRGSSLRSDAPELTTEATGDENVDDHRDAVLTAWSRAMDAVHADDVDMAFAEVLSTEDDLLLVKLMNRTGPVIYQLSIDVVIDVLTALARFLLDPNRFHICLSWLQHMLDAAVDGGEYLDYSEELRREILMNLNKATSTFKPPKKWKGMAPDQLLLVLASTWDVDLQQLKK